MNSILKYRAGFLPKIYIRHKKQRKVQKLTCTAITDTSVLYDYIDLYAKYICVHDMQECLSSAVVPSLQEQIQVVQEFNNTIHNVQSVHDLQGIILKLIITHDASSLDALINTLQQYNNCIDIIRSIIEYTNDIPLPSNENEIIL